MYDHSGLGFDPLQIGLQTATSVTRGAVETYQQKQAQARQAAFRAALPWLAGGALLLLLLRRGR